jgi:hypothetical protein
MRLISILALAGFTAAEASIYGRQVATVVNVINQITTDTKDLDTIVKSFSGAGDVPKLQAASDKLATTVTDGVDTVNNASSLSLTDALQIQGQVQALQSTVETTVNDLISKKSTIVSAGAGARVETSLQQQLKGAQQLSTAISSKVPSEVSGLAQQFSSGITNALQKGVDAFKDTGGAAATSGGTTASGAASATVNAATSATASSTAGAVSSAAAALSLNGAGSLVTLAALVALAL